MTTPQRHSNHWRYRGVEPPADKPDPRTLSERTLFGMWPEITVFIVLFALSMWGLFELSRVIVEQQ